MVAAGLLFVPLPISNSIAGRTLENAGHTPLFALITLGCLLVLRNDFGQKGARLYLLAGLLGVATGFLTEVIQKPLARDASWGDVMSDTVGVACGLALFALFDRQSGLRKGARAVAFLIALTCITMYVAPVVRMTRAYLHRNAQFPVLADFSSRIELFWIVGYGANRRIERGALEVDFDADTFPGISLHEPMPDWRHYRTLAIDVENPATESLNLGVRVHDRGRGRVYNDRFNRRFQLGAGERRIVRIPLEDIRNAPRNRRMNMAQVSDVTLFRGGRSGSRQLRVYSLRLE